MKGIIDCNYTLSLMSSWSDALREVNESRRLPGLLDDLSVKFSLTSGNMWRIDVAKRTPPVVNSFDCCRISWSSNQEKRQMNENGLNRKSLWKGKHQEIKKISSYIPGFFSLKPLVMRERERKEQLFSFDWYPRAKQNLLTVNGQEECLPSYRREYLQTRTPND